MKWIVITGVSGLLGESIANACLEKLDFGVIAVNRRKNEAIVRLEDRYPERFRYIEFDLSDVSQVKELYLKSIKKIGPVYGLVNNAALAYSDIVTNAREDALTTMFNVNVIAPMMLSKYALRDMLLNKTKGVLVHISSVSASTGYKGLSMYASTKGALESFSRGVAREWGPKGIRSVCVAPGFMETEMSSSLSEEQRNKIYRRSSLQSQTELRSVADTVAFVLSEGASSITGEVIHVDCGSI